MTKRISNPDDLKALREKAQAAIALRGATKDIQITVHLGTCGITAGAHDVLAAFTEELDKASGANVTLRQAGCAGLCEREPMATYKDAQGHEFRYGNLDAKKTRAIVQQHVLAGKPVVDCLIK